jgi:hypothetical protein
MRLECNQLIALAADDDRIAEMVRSSDKWQPATTRPTPARM